MFAADITDWLNYLFLLYLYCIFEKSYTAV